ncbi:MAG: flagellar hook protein FlgE [Selenomonadaceae bacterium]|nr:flagellar hook protein FlgE [Selenomonadaceae bacterium]
MMRSLFSGVSGLKNHQTRMDVIGNNISNVNTTGFKSSRVTFVDTLSQTLTGASSPKGTLGGTNPKQIGLGSGVGSIDLMFTDGSVQSTGKNTDLCLSGNGLFVVRQGNETYYTRDGAFEFDADGNYVLPGSGMYMQGWMGTDGNIDTTAAIGNIVVQAGKSMAAQATQQVTYSNNLKADVPMIVSMSQGGISATTANPTFTASATSPVTMKLSDGSTFTETTGKYYLGSSRPVVTSVNVYDSLGGTHEIPVYFMKEGTITSTTASSSTAKSVDIWQVSLDSSTWSPLSTAATTSVPKTGVSSKMTYLNGDGTSTNVSMNVTKLQFTNSGAYDADSGDGRVIMTFTSGSIGTTGTVPATTATLNQPVTIDFSSLTQFVGNNTIVGKEDGNAAGTLKSIQIDSSGTITGVYTNGVRQAEAQVAVAQFTNASGLTKTGNSLYQASNNSGVANIKTASDLGVTITPSALEMSNVDVANEFSDMIITQRGFQSNSKIVTVSDEMLETVINMKR